LSHSEYIFGLDVSHYQGRINWKRVSTSKHPIKYVFIRSTMGINGKDKQFLYNWRKAKDFGYIRGAYHYYRPNENPESQFLNYKKMVRLSKGDFIPILDVEQMGRKVKKKIETGYFDLAKNGGKGVWGQTYGLYWFTFLQTESERSYK